MLALPQSRPSVVTLQNKSFSPSISSLSASAEKGIPVSSRDVLPTPPTSTATIRARDRRAEPAPTTFQRAREWISLYRIFFTVILTVNTVGAGFTLARKWTDGEEYAATFALCNIMAGILARNEVFLRALYTVLLFLFKRWPPYIFRSAIANFLLHFGGLHSGFAASGTLWLIVATIQFFRQGPTEINPVILAFCILASVLLLTVCASAYPALRNSHHNVFENTHRLVGWFGLAVLWVLVCIADSWDASLQRFVGTMLISRPDIYLAIALTVCIALPWTTLRKVEVEARVLSSSVVHLRFKAGYRPGLFGRVSRHPLRENHAFGIASTSPSSGEHSMYIVGQGDFTRGLIADPPTYLWTRSFKFVGLPYMASFYRSGVYVVTGSAIGVALSVFLQLDPGSKWHLLWICGNVHETYGSTAIKDLKASFDDETTYNETVTIWDTRKQGRPDLIELVSAQVEHQQAEVVFVTSNPKGTADTIRACAKRGIPCLGPVWDS
ncbi:hypothetical protein BJ138DRAFT_302359 [Hygrophoropsis aurantiaca]|uniref:Uncharacterized protein n=1 Tax=Hygrophoropsis aurantiaca TaxID=72124 RepID=A0ACB8A741_9AGAM|nr:hypothetical protein BJ138DRAFT_302359 [Hygrophoropsis aurantiaca]